MSTQHGTLWRVRGFRDALPKCPENSLAACADPVQIEVHLTAAALNGEQRENIFQPFYTTKSQGSGLGMAITRRIVEAHAGHIAVGAPDMPGTEILITLPRGTR